MYVEGNLVNRNSIYYKNDKLIIKIRIYTKNKDLKVKTIYLKGYYVLNISSDLINKIQINHGNLMKKTIKSFKYKRIDSHAIDYYFNIKKYTDFLPIDCAYVDGNLNDTFNENIVHVGKSYGYKLRIKNYEFNVNTPVIEYRTSFSNSQYEGSYLADDPLVLYVDKFEQRNL